MICHPTRTQASSSSHNYTCTDAADSAGAVQRAAGGHCKSWTLDSGLDRGLDCGLDYGPKFGLDSGQSLASVTTISYDALKTAKYSSLHRPCKVQSASSQFSKLHDHTGK